ncbi:MAG: ABC transporter substrate-binding protein [Bacteroidaceae bacterium]|nr:ABC transporter substrate-binding protein [Bacteroidaceae bacterium]
MITLKRHFLLFPLLIPAIVLALAACGHSPRPAGDTDSALVVVDTLELHYARGFRVRTLANGVRLVDVADPQADEDRMPVSYHFALMPTDSAPVPSSYTPVPVPVDRTIVMTMLQLSNFTALDALDVVRGITGTKNLFNKDVRARVDDGRIVKIGMEGNFDTELILAAQPEVIFISPFKRGGYDAIKETGITLIPHLGYKELHPLGQAEWVKFVGLFLGKEHEADSLFAQIEERYNGLKEKTQSLSAERGEAGAMKSSGNETLPPAGGAGEGLPTVFSGEMHGGNWYAVGGRSALAQLFRDAGADYVIKDENTGGVNIEFEQLYAAAAEADYWRILNSYPGDFSYEALEASEPRNKLFRAFRERKVIYCNMKQTPYYELSPMQPDVLLADLIAIFHPALMPQDYQPTFYQLLR